MTEPSSCCAPSVQASCCEPAAKESCCGTPTGAAPGETAGCGCAAGSTSTTSTGTATGDGDDPLPVELPIAVISGGPVGLAAAAHLWTASPGA